MISSDDPANIGDIENQLSEEEQLGEEGPPQQRWAEQQSFFQRFMQHVIHTP